MHLLYVGVLRQYSRPLLLLIARFTFSMLIAKLAFLRYANWLTRHFEGFSIFLLQYDWSMMSERDWNLKASCCHMLASAYCLVQGGGLLKSEVLETVNPCILRDLVSVANHVKQ